MIPSVNIEFGWKFEKDSTNSNSFMVTNSFCLCVCQIWQTNYGKNLTNLIEINLFFNLINKLKKLKMKIKVYEFWSSNNSEVING